MKRLLQTIFLTVVFLASGGLSVQANSNGALTDLGNPGHLMGQYQNFFGAKDAMIADEEGNIWIGIGFFGLNAPDTLGYLFKYSNGEWELFTRYNSGLPDSRIRCLHSHAGKLFVGTPSGLAVYDGEWELVTMDDGLPSNDIRSVLVDSNVIYIGTEQGLSIWDGSDRIHFNTGNSAISGNLVKALELDDQGRLWVGTSTGLSTLMGGFWEQIPAAANLDINVLKADPYGNLWIGSNNEAGFHKLREGTLADSKEFGIFKLHPNNKVKSIAVSSEGHVYAGIRAERVHTILKVTEYNNYMYVFDIQNAFTTIVNDEIYVSGSTPRNLYLFNPNLADMYDNFAIMEVNNIRTAVTSLGRIGFDLDQVSSEFYEVPKDGGAHALFTQTLWAGGKSGEGENTQLHLMGERYRQIGRDAWPGPVSTDVAAYFATQLDWNRVWTVTKSQIEDHIANWDQAGYQMPYAILSWPGNGNQEYGQSALVAPFHDTNENDIYEPHLGDYPKIRGDKALFFVFNDHRYPHTETGGQALGIEVTGMVYGFDAPDNEFLNNTLFLNYQVFNLSENTYSDFYLSLFTDFSLGDAWDDFIGCDTMLHAYYVYNSQASDGGGEAGTYGQYPPAMGVGFLNQPLSVFIPSFNSANDAFGDPRTASQYYNFMTGHWRDGQPLVYGNNGYPTGSGDVQVKHIYPGDISYPEAWHELSANNGEPNLNDDKRGIGSVKIGAFEPGESICFDIALVYSRDLQNPWPTGSVNKLKTDIDSVREFYEANFDNNCQDLVTVSVPEKPATVLPALHCYPNPTSGDITIAFDASNKRVVYSIYNSIGGQVKAGQLFGKNTLINLSDLPSGLYIVRVQDGNTTYAQRFIKH